MFRKNRATSKSERLNSEFGLSNYVSFWKANPGLIQRSASKLLRCGTSIGSNVEEAQAAESRADFISKNNISLKEARETHYRLRLLAAAEIVSQSRLQPILDEALELKRILGAIVVSAKRNSKSKSV